MTRRTRLIAVMLIVSLAAACSTAATPTPARTALTVGLGYIPSVQFAPFYLADQAGYYRDAGLDVTFQNKIETDLVRLVGAGAIDVGVADGTDVVPAVSQGIPVRYLATVYRSYPSVVFTPATSGIATPADLAGRKIGIPGRYGSSWVMLQALLGSAGLTPDDVTIVEYPDFGQAAAVQQGAVDAATGFVNNEPVQLGLEGIPTTILTVDSIVPLPGPGLIAGTSTLAAKEAAVRAFIAATIRAMTEIAAKPGRGLDAAEVVVPELKADRTKQSAILDATIKAWRGSGGALGMIDEAGWASTVTFLTDLGLVPNPVKVQDLVRTDMLPG
ncbi:MAG: ABC transporter substrate-binding protein [Chloroflexi bacterium]|nr:ABC transporter substrate-binding protein [Chloroflexota bacterium]